MKNNVVNNSTNIGPYELRLELLKLATDHHRDQYFWSKEAADREFAGLQATVGGLGTQQYDMKTYKAELEKIKFPAPYTLDQVLATAEKLRAFIDTKHVSYDSSTGEVRKQLLNE